MLTNLRSILHLQRSDILGVLRLPVVRLHAMQIFRRRLGTGLFFPISWSWAAPAAHGDSQARGPIGAVATSLRQSHSNAGSEPRLQPALQLMAMPDP